MSVYKKGLWGALSGTFLVLAVGSFIGGDIAFTQGSAAINMALGTSNTITINDPNAEAVDFYTSSYSFMTKEDKYKKETAEKLYEEDKKCIENATAEGVTLLWNKNKALPLAKDEKAVSLLSHSSVDLVEGGSGSGFIKTTSMDGTDVSTNMKDAFENKGYDVNPTLWNFYKSGAGNQSRTNPGTACTEWRVWSVNEPGWSKYTSSVTNSFTTYGDVAFITLSRTGGEYSDLHYNYESYSDFTGKNAKGTSENKPEDGGYLGLTDTEEELFSHVCQYKANGTFGKVVLLLNTPNPVMFRDIVKYYGNIDACLWIGQPGATGINAVVDVVKGTVNPSGRLPDTFMYDLNSAPATENDGSYKYSGSTSGLASTNNRYTSYMVYQEGIYVGYRYYETRYEDSILNPTSNANSTKGAKNSANGWKYEEEVAFPFGYGDSYTKFEYSNYSATQDASKNVTLKVTVKNIGEVAGKEVVQAYMQKPYTDYDKTNKIEKASVELKGYAKTKLLKKGESETVTIKIPYEEFKTYDANVEKTYIIEAGDYYLTIANDSHNALNNIIAKKNSGVKSSLVEQYAGNYVKNNKTNIDENFATKFTLAKDFTTFAKSVQTGAEITNQFDNGDINKYVNRGTNEVTYLSRNNWDATYPVTPTLTLNADMIADINPNHVPDDTGVEMPKYGVFKSGATDGSPLVEQGDVVAYQFMDAPLYPELASEEQKKQIIDGKPYVQYWTDMWNQLLDQMTWNEQALMSANAYHQVNGAQSVALPSSKQENGPVGITKRSDFPVPDKNVKYYYFVSYPCASLIAATFNDETAEDVGKHMSEDMLFLGYNGIYGPGVNMHRTPYGGRAYEYPSEDPYLAGVIEYAESKGIESKGCLAYAKHFALNDTETNRRHVGVWSNEQATREIYLRAFELCFKEGGASATMNSFSRIGTRWNGGCKEIMTNVLRTEWGWDGLNITDWATDGPMSYVDAICAGTNSFDGNGQASKYSPWKDNAVVAQGLRQSAKVIIHNIVKTNAMNGTAISSKVLAVTPWWETAIYVIQGVFTTMLVVSAAFFVCSFFFGVKKNKTKKGAETTESAATAPTMSPTKAKIAKFGAIGLGGLGLIGILLSVLLPISQNIEENKRALELQQNIETPPGGEEDPENPPVPTDVPEDTGTKTSHVFEFEDAEFDGLSGNNNKTYGHICAARSLIFDKRYSGNFCVRNISSTSVDNKFIFTFTSDKTVMTTVTMGLSSHRTGSSTWVQDTLSYGYVVANNGKAVNVSDVVVPQGTSADIVTSDYFAMVTTTFKIPVYQGQNKLTFTTNNNTFNPDYIDISTSAALTGFTPAYSWGKADNIITISKAPSVNADGTLVIGCKDSTCTEPTVSCVMPKLTDSIYTKGTGADANKYSIKILDKTYTYEDATVVTDPAVGKVHNESKTVTLKDGQNFFQASNWFTSANDNGYLTKEDIINANGELVFENSGAKQSAAKIKLFNIAEYDDKSGYVHPFDKKSNIETKFTNQSSLIGMEFSYEFAIKTTGEFTMLLGGNKAGTVDPNTNGTNVGQFITFTGSKAIFTQTGSNTNKSVGEVSANCTITPNALTNIKICISRLDLDHLVTKLYVNGTKIDFAAEAVASAVNSVVGGNFVTTVITSTGLGQRFGINPAAGKNVTISNLTLSEKADTFTL